MKTTETKKLILQIARDEFMKELEQKGVRINHVDEKEMHLILSAQYSAMLDMIVL